jgi:hypothetical protein
MFKQSLPPSHVPPAPRCQCHVPLQGLGRRCVQLHDSSRYEPRRRASSPFSQLINNTLLRSLTDSVAKSLTNLIITVLVRIATLPYYRLYHFNTVSPLEKIALLASMSLPDNTKILRAVSFWRARKLIELQFITIAVRAALIALTLNSYN